MTVVEIVDSARSIPLVRHSWESRLSGLRTILECMDQAADPERYEVQSWHELNEALDDLARARQDLLAMLVALAPFDSRDLSLTEREHPPADEATGARGLGADLLAAADSVVDSVLDAIERGEVPGRAGRPLASLTPATPTIALGAPAEVWAVTFGMTAVPVGADGSFSASKVFEAYKYNNRRLLDHLLAHMRSLALEPVDDVLAMTTICGWISSAPDAVFAWQACREMLIRLMNSGGESLAATLGHLDSRAEALRQGRRLIQARINGFLAATDRELAAHDLADAYKRLLDGPVSEYGWAMRRLSLGAWEPTPTVGLLSQAFEPDPWLAPAVTPILMTDLRNGQAHEDLEWDGKRNLFTAAGSSIDLRRVDVAVADALSFTLGCESALAYVRARAATSGAVSPVSGEAGRMADWQRAEAIVGTNGLRLVSLTHNAITAELRIERLQVQDINPAFQWLLHARNLLPGVESFAVLTDGATNDVAPISVSAAVLDTAYPVWVRARECFDSMPLSVFLPINLAARLHDEAANTACAAAAWIALDDALSAIDEQPEEWSAESLWVVKARIEVADLALGQCIGMTAEQEVLEAARRVLASVSADLSTLEGHSDADSVDALLSVVNLRKQWNRLGPVARLPRVTESRWDPSPGYRTFAIRRTTSPTDRYTSM